MSDFFIMVVQSIVQGITEFLPISSSAHLILVWDLYQNAFTVHQMMTLDVALHVGTLLAVVAFFWSDVLKLIAGGIDILRFKDTPARAEAINILVASIPLIVVGFLLKDWITEVARAPIIIAFTTIFFGILLWAGDYYGQQNPRTDKKLKLGEALFIGISQVFALIPGTSRSGVTMTAARFCGVDRVEAARFALLLSIPAILGAGTLSGLDLIQSGDVEIGALVVFGIVLSAIAAYLAIWLMVSWLKTSSFLPFVIYRLGLGLVLLYFLM